MKYTHQNARINTLVHKLAVAIFLNDEAGMRRPKVINKLRGQLSSAGFEPYQIENSLVWVRHDIEPTDERDEDYNSAVNAMFASMPSFSARALDRIAQEVAA